MTRAPSAASCGDCTTIPGGANCWTSRWGRISTRWPGRWRKFNWRIQPGGAAALSLIGLSTQVPARYLYLSDGPSRTYTVGKTTLDFKHQALKDTGFRHEESAIIVQALKALGEERVNDREIEWIRAWLPAGKRRAVAQGHTRRDRLGARGDQANLPRG